MTTVTVSDNLVIENLRISTALTGGRRLEFLPETCVRLLSTTDEVTEEETTEETDENVSEEEPTDETDFEDEEIVDGEEDITDEDIAEEEEIVEEAMTELKLRKRQDEEVVDEIVPEEDGTIEETPVEEDGEESTTDEEVTEEATDGTTEDTEETGPDFELEVDSFETEPIGTISFEDLGKSDVPATECLSYFTQTAISTFNVTTMITLNRCFYPEFTLSLLVPCVDDDSR